MKCKTCGKPCIAVYCDALCESAEVGDKTLVCDVNGRGMSRSTFKADRVRFYHKDIELLSMTLSADELPKIPEGKKYVDQYRGIRRDGKIKVVDNLGTLRCCASDDSIYVQTKYVVPRASIPLRPEPMRSFSE